MHGMSNILWCKIKCQTETETLMSRSQMHIYKVISFTHWICRNAVSCNSRLTCRMKFATGSFAKSNNIRANVVE